MKIAIVGAGEVGTHLAKLLTRENINIVLMDEQESRLRDLETNYDMLTRVGSPTSLNDLRNIGVKDADLFVAVTPEESRNLTSCLLATKLGAKKTLARIDNYEYLLPENKPVFEQMGLNHLIYPEVLAANEILESLQTSWMRYHITLADGLLHLCIIKVRKGADIIGKKFSSGYFLNGRYRIVAIKREQRTFIPCGDDEIMSEDLVYFLCTKENIDFVREQAGKLKREVRNVILMGGSRIARKVAQEAPEKLKIKIIEKDRDTCMSLAEKLSNTLIINADATNIDVLREEGIRDADAFVALTDNSATNIFACLTARKLGTGKTIAEIENIDYIHMAEGLDIGAILNKKTIAASYIYQLLMDASVLSVHNLTTADAEMIEFIVTDKSRITRTKIRDAHLPQDVNIGAIIRAGEVVLADGDTQILAGDHVSVFCTSKAIRQLDYFFR